MRYTTLLFINITYVKFKAQFPIVHFWAVIEFVFVVLLSSVSIPMHAERDIIIRTCPSVRPSVRHTLVLHRNKCTYRQKLFPPSAKSMTRLFERYHRYKILRGTPSAGR